MVWRQQFGERNGVYGGWISKPGYDVTTCAPGDFLLDTNAQVFQCVLTGDTGLLTVGAGTVAAGAYTTAVGLPGEFAPFSNLVVNAIYYILTASGTTFIGQNNTTTYLKHNTVSGVLNLSVVLRASMGGFGGDPQTHRARWSVFRAQF
jgi:hypothetical protein